MRLLRALGWAIACLVLPASVAFDGEAHAEANGHAVGQAVEGLPNAVWADANNDGHVDGYVLNGQYFPGAPPSALLTDQRPSAPSTPLAPAATQSRSQSEPATARTNRQLQADEWVERGNQFFRSGAYQRAVEAYHQAQVLDPSNPAGFNGAGVAEMGLAKFDLAEREFKAGLRSSPNNQELKSNLQAADLSLNNQRQQQAQYERENQQRTQSNANVLLNALGAFATGYQAGLAMQPSRPAPPPPPAAPPRQLAVAPPAPTSAQVMAQRQAQLTAQLQAASGAQSPSQAQSQAEANRLKYQQMQDQRVAEDNAKVKAMAEQQRAQSAAALAAARAGRSVAPTTSASSGGGGAGVILRGGGPGFATNGGGCDTRFAIDGVHDCNAIRRQQQQVATLAPIQQREAEERRLRQQQINEENSRRAAENLRQMNAYRAQQDQQERQQQQQIAAAQQRVNDEIRSPGAVRVNSYADSYNSPRFTAFNNTSVWLTINISYELRGDDGSYYRGDTFCSSIPHSSCDWVYYPGPVDVKKHWTVQNLNVTWHQ